MGVLTDWSDRAGIAVEITARSMSGRREPAMTIPDTASTADHSDVFAETLADLVCAAYDARDLAPIVVDLPVPVVLESVAAACDANTFLLRLVARRLKAERRRLAHEVVRAADLTQRAQSHAANGAYLTRIAADLADRARGLRPE